MSILEEINYLAGKQYKEVRTRTWPEQGHWRLAPGGGSGNSAGCWDRGSACSLIGEEADSRVWGWAGPLSSPLHIPLFYLLQNGFPWAS